MDRIWAALALVIGAVGLIQGVAWIGAHPSSPQFGRRVIGAWLAPLGLTLLAGAALHLLVPDFWGDQRSALAPTPPGRTGVSAPGITNRAGSSPSPSPTTARQ
jgi:hypothetical protein